MKDKEQLMMERMERDADYFMRKFPDQMEALQNDSPLKRVKSISVFDVYALGEMLQQFENYKNWMMEEGTASDLGTLPNIALDVIAAAYGQSILPLIASVQPIDEEHGTVYFKVLKAVSARGNVSANQSFQDPRSVPAVYPDGYAAEKVTYAIGNTTGALLSYSGTLAKFPVRPNTISFTVATTSPLTATDDGNGNLLGVGISGTIDYTTGNWTLVLAADPTVGKAISTTYGTDFENSGAVPQMNLVTESTSVNAEIFALGSEMGIFKAYSMKKRFGMIAEDEMAQDLTNQLTAELGNAAISRLVAACPASGLTWNRQPPVGVAWELHKPMLKDTLVESEGTILTQAGRGTISVLIAGATAASLLGMQPGFVKQQIGSSGPQVYGTLDGITIIRSPTVGAAKIYPLYRGTGYFDAPMVYAPYMPLMVTEATVVGNILKRQKAAAVWAALKVVVPNFITDLTITNVPPTLPIPT